MPVILIELGVIVVGLIAFGWWQLRDVARAQNETLVSSRPGTPSQPEGHDKPPLGNSSHDQTR